MSQSKDELPQYLQDLRPEDPPRIAPEGKVWVCRACGKVARDRYGSQGARTYGWDESCMLNSVLTDEPGYLDRIARMEAAK